MASFNAKMNSNEEMKTLNSGNPAYSYDEVFPALPGGLPGGIKVQNGPNPVNQAVIFNNQHNKMRINSTEVTQVFCVPAEERKYDHSEKFGESESLRTCTQISKETGARIEISTSKDKSLTFLITGKVQSVQEARRKVLINFQTQANISISIPKDHHRWILGQKGQRLKDLEKNTGTKISIPAINDQSDKITVVGTRESIEKAVHEIRVISDEQSKKAFVRVSVPKIYHPFVTGANNEKINQLSHETNTRINIPPPSVDNTEITITGEKEGVLNAKNRIMQIYQDMEKNCKNISVEVPKWQHKYVIGHKGSTMAEILQETGVSVEVPPADVVGDTITLRGPCQVLGDALKYLFAKATSMQCVEIDAPSNIHKLIIGKKAAFIKDLQETYKQCHVEFINGSDKIRVECLPDVINEVKQKLEERVHYYLHEYATVEIDVNPKHFKHIIGKSGGNVNRLKSGNDVSITITDDTKNCIKIEGAKDDVAVVKRELEEQIRKLENEREIEIHIDQKHHRTYSGNRRRELQDLYKVNIIFPNVGDTSDVVKIKGQKEDVDKCKEYILKSVKELDENSYTLKVPIYKQFHRFVIGRAGANIKKIRDDTTTKIDLPSEGDKNDLITITGKKENVEEARDRILKIQKEMELVHGITEEASKPKPEAVATNEKPQPTITIEIKAKPEHHKFLIGKSGLKIKKVRDLTGARITFPNEGDEDKERIIIQGRKDAVERAKEELESMIDQINNTVEEVVHVNPKYHKHFISNRGELIHKISEDCGGVTISFPRLSSAGPNESKVIVKGKPNGVKEAIKRIEQEVQELEEQITIEVYIPNRDHKVLIRSRTPPTISDIERQNNVKISFADRISGDNYQQNGISEINGHAEDKDQAKPCDIVYITGKPENCESAKQSLLDIVPITLELNIPYGYHGSIIGPSGKHIRDIINEHDVQVDVPQIDKKLDLIKIRGRPASVEKAKEAILRRKKKIDDEREEKELRSYVVRLDVDPEYHPQIIGRKGEVIKKIRNDHNVTISLPKKEDPDNIISITGLQQDVEAAKEDILSIVQRLESRYREEINIDRRVHPRMIGAKGRQIRKIMEEFDVEIRFPRNTDADPNTVVIFGDEDKIADCKDHLLTLEEDFLQNVHDDVKAPSTADTIFDGGNTRNNRDEAGFVVKNAPWDQKAPDTSSIAEFPSFGAVDNSKTFAQLGSESKPAWGPRR
ncbi:vigilin-like isoform X2 [Planococcus citri]|uniref:vigilin-like isoform X2 n=1 Tax=Planococcus citri TaxID=170843 RepID=UPI0031F89813